MIEQIIPLTAIEPHVWAVDADGRYWNAFGPWGGWTAGALLEAAMAEPEGRGTPVAMTLHFMAGFEKGPAELRTRLLRGGKSLQFWSVELTQGGPDKVAAQAVVTRAVRPETVAYQDMTMPSVPTPDALPVGQEFARAGGAGPNFFQMCDTRPIKGFPTTVSEAGDTHSITWSRDGAKRPMNYVLMAMLADLFPPRIYFKRGPGMASTISMTIYFHGAPEEIAVIGEDFILSEAVGRKFGAGVFDQEARLWRRDGLLLATSEQMCWYK